jgi:hypothetical protein
MASVVVATSLVGPVIAPTRWLNGATNHLVAFTEIFGEEMCHLLNG